MAGKILICLDCLHHRVNPRGGGLLCAAPQLELKDADDPAAGFVAGASAAWMRERYAAGQDPDLIEMHNAALPNGICTRAGRWFQPITKEAASA
jgi:hypothetical protein